jgi:shikimate kinase
MKIFLVGFMGCGKSTIGRMLAREQRCSYIDMDRQLVARHNLSINEMFSKYGESFFRKSEQEFLTEIVDRDEPMIVVATGGGVACNPDNMDMMLKSGVVIYLKRTREGLLRRLVAGQHSRPLISGKTPEEIGEFIDKTLAEREPHYLRANITIDCDYIGDAAIVDIVRMALDYESRERSK